jgi:hypothetical protein
MIATRMPVKADATAGINTDTLVGSFDPPTLAHDLAEVRRIYAAFFEGLTVADWDRPTKRGPMEWTLHETMAHLCALNGAGLESIQATLRGQPYTFAGLPDRYHFTAYTRRGIDEHLPLPTPALCAELLDILDQASRIAREVPAWRLEQATPMPIYNRPVKLIEALSIIVFHTGLNHSAQVAEPAGRAPLWTLLTPDIRQRVIGRVMRALSLLYRRDLGQDLRAVYVFQVDGPGGGIWHVAVSPEGAMSGEGAPDRVNLTLRLRSTDVFCQMFTGRLNLLTAILTGRLRLRGDLRLFGRMGSLFSVDAKG